MRCVVLPFNERATVPEMSSTIVMGIKKVDSRKVLFLTRVIYSRRMIRPIFFMPLGLNVLKLTGNGSSFHQPDENIIQGGQKFPEVGDITFPADEIFQHFIGRMPFPDAQGDAVFFS